MSMSLALSLGHNSSAVLIQDGRVLAGYEEERFTGVKADSRFPINALDELRARFRLPKDTNTYVGHWFPDASLPAPNKYWNPQYIRDAFPHGDIDSLNADFTHHDSHLQSAMVFAGRNFAQKYHAVVADGFGNFGEVISMYEVEGEKYRLLHRVFGFEKSLGLLYQYATAFMGMKMHNHEYKMLAYEVHIDEVVEDWEKRALRDMILDTAQDYLKRTRQQVLTNEFDPVTKLEALPNVQDYINKILTNVLKEMNLLTASEYDKRVCISYFVQGVVEAVMLNYVKSFGPKSLLVVGGLFYNVKLNHLLCNEIDGKFCAMPLAGDQGAGLGVYHAYRGDLVWPEHLFWGHRSLNFNENDLPKGFFVVENEGEAYEMCHAALKSRGWVNLVRGAMEYGPRALCNTTTLAIPTRDVAEQINRANNRTMEMPFAPVMTREQAEYRFHGVDKVHKSLEYMIITRQYHKDQVSDVKGAAHFYPELGIHTGRPQITDDPFLVTLLEDGPLVNTSYNFHGVPIVRSPEQILHTHNMQRETAPDLDPITVVIRS